MNFMIKLNIFIFLISSVLLNCNKNALKENIENSPQNDIKIVSSLIVGDVSANSVKLKKEDIVQLDSVIRSEEKSFGDFQIFNKNQNFSTLRVKEESLIHLRTHSLDDGKYILLEIEKGKSIIKTNEKSFDGYFKIILPGVVLELKENSEVDISLKNSETGALTLLEGSARLRVKMPGYLDSLSYSNLEKSKMDTILLKYYSPVYITIEKGKKFPVENAIARSFIKKAKLENIFMAEPIVALSKSKEPAEAILKNASEYISGLGIDK